MKLEIVVKTSTCSISESFVIPMISFESLGLNTSALFIRGTDLSDRSERNRKSKRVGMRCDAG